jgi:hypothetical protein
MILYCVTQFSSTVMCDSCYCIVELQCFPKWQSCNAFQHLLTGNQSTVLIMMWLLTTLINADYFQVVRLDVSNAFWPPTVLPVTDVQQLPDLSATTRAAFRKFTQLHSAMALHKIWRESIFVCWTARMELSSSIGTQPNGSYNF